MNEVKVKWKKFGLFGGPVIVLLLWYFISAYVRLPGELSQLWIAIFGALAFGAVCGMFAGLHLRVWLGFAYFGLLIGIMNSYVFFFGIIEDGQFIVGLVTFIFFFALALVAGAFGEFIAYLHHLSHGYKPKDYAKKVKEKEELH